MRTNAPVILVAALVAGLATSCATKSLWKATDPDAHVLLPAEQVSEAELRDRGVPFLKDDHGLYHLGKTPAQRFGDHALRFALTPAALCVDAAPYAALFVLEGLAIQSGGRPIGARLDP